MGIFGMMRTSLSGMNAQSDRLSSVADNVANSSTIGYKKSLTQFSDLVNNESLNGYQSGGVQTHTRFDIDSRGGLLNTGDAQDLSIEGNGFFLVTDKLDGSGAVMLTRAGDFRPDKNGNLRNSAGFYLLSRDDSHAVVNVGNKEDLKQKAQVTSKIDLQGNLPYNHAAVKKSPFNAEDASTYSYKTSCNITGKHGEPVTVDIYFVKTDTGWTAQIPAKITAGTPPKVEGYTAKKLAFDSDGNLTPAVTSAITLLEDAQDTNGSTINLNIPAGKFRTSGTNYAVTANPDGHGDGHFQSYTIDETGHLVLSLTNGQKMDLAQIQLATVEDTSKLLSQSGTTFKRTSECGTTITGYPGSGVFGSVQNSTLEQSNADIATELTDMIESQRTYTANTKVFQTGSELMQSVLAMIR